MDKTGGELLIEAIRRDDLKGLQKLIADGADVNEAPEEVSPLVVASEDGKLAMVEALLKSGADPDVGGIRVPLCAATASGEIEIIRRLLDAGASIEDAEEDGVTALILAAAMGNPKIVKLLIERGANANAVDDEGRNALDSADDPKVIAFLSPLTAKRELEQQSDEPAAEPVEATPAADLAAAAGEGDAARVKKLLDAGRDPNGIDEDGRTPLFMAVSRQHADIAPLLLKAGADPNIPIRQDDGIDFQYGGRLLPCVNCGKPFMAMTWIRHCPACGKPFDTREREHDAPTRRPLIFTYANDWTPLMAAARLNHVTLATLLLDAGAKVDNGRLDCTPLMCACSYEHVEMIKLLLSRGANVNAVCKETGRASMPTLTAIEIVGEEGQIELMELLWSAGAKTKEKDAARLVAAARNGDVGRIEALLKSGVDANVIDPFTAHTPIYAAAGTGMAGAVKLLLQSGATTAPPRKGAASPLLIACAAIGEGLSRRHKTEADVPRFVETIKLLIDAGAPVKIALWGQTPLGLAKEGKCEPLIALLETALAKESAGKAAKKGAKKK